MKAAANRCFRSRCFTRRRGKLCPCPLALVECRKARSREIRSAFFLMLVRLTTTVVASYLRRRRIQKKGRSMQFRSPRVILNGVISNLNPTSVLCAAFFSDGTYALSGLGAHVKSFATEIFPRPDARCEACKQLPAHSLHFVLSWGSRTYFLRQPIKR